MTHFNTNLRLPVRAGPSPMEDLIVQQVEWYMGRLNLEKDDYLKGQMDDDLWVSLDIILNFPKMQRLGVQDKRRVATLLHARSTIVEVDENAARIRPAWARRSTIIIHNVPANARLDQITALLQIPSNADLTNTQVPPTVTHPPGLISIQPARDTIWLAIFDSPTGAQDSVHLLLDKEINGQKVNPEVLVENSLRPTTAYRQQDTHSPVFDNQRPVDQQNSNTAYPQGIPVMSTGMMTNQMMNPMGMPMPVMHHPSQDAHPQYTYAPPPTGYAPGYAQNMPVPRQFMGAPRGMHAGYVMTYPQTEHAYDPAHGVLPANQIRPQQQQQQVDQNSAPILAPPPIPAEGATAGQPVPTVPNGVPPPASGDGTAEAETPEFVQDASISQVQADAQRIAAQIPYAAPVQIPVIPGQPIDGQMMPVKPVDMHYMHRAQMIGDPNMYAARGNGRQQGMGRDRGQRNADGSVRASRGSMMDGQRSGTHRKGKKGNRGGGRHGHAHDRDRRDGKGDGSSSDSGNREDRSLKNKPEPNLASMHFPPLPMSDNAGVRAPPNMLLKKEDSDEKPPVPATAKDAKEVVADAVVESIAPTDSKTGSVGIESENVAASPEPVSEKEITLKESTVNQVQKTDANENGADVAKVTEEPSVVKEQPTPAEVEKKHEAKTPSVSAPSPMSYAAILRSKKPGPPPRPVHQPPVSRSSSGASGKNTDNSSGSEANSSGPSKQPPKEKGGRRRKSNNSRNNHIGDTKDADPSSNGSKNEKHTEKKANDAAPATPAEPKPMETSSGGAEPARSKPVVENTRAHSVWANKPKSLFQAASAAPAGRAANAPAPMDAKKISSPVSSQGDEKEAGSEKSAKEANNRAAPNGKTSGSGAARNTKEEGKDAKANGTMETKDAAEKPADKLAISSKGSSDSTKSGKGSKGTDKAANVSAKGAWAAGGPKTWPKNATNGVMEKMSNTTES